MIEEHTLKVKICSNQTNPKLAHDKSLGQTIIFPFTNLVKKHTFESVFFSLI